MIISACCLVLLEKLVKVVVQLVPPRFCFAAVASILCSLLFCLHHTHQCQSDPISV